MDDTELDAAEKRLRDPRSGNTEWLLEIVAALRGERVRASQLHAALEAIARESSPGPNEFIPNAPSLETWRKAAALALAAGVVSSTQPDRLVTKVNRREDGSVESISRLPADAVSSRAAKETP